MKQFFKDDKDNLSMGRLLSFLVFLVVTFVFVYVAITEKELTNNIRDLIIAGWGTAILGKGVQKFAEVKK